MENVDRKNHCRYIIFIPLIIFCVLGSYAVLLMTNFTAISPQLLELSSRAGARFSVSFTNIMVSGRNSEKPASAAGEYDGYKRILMWTRWNSEKLNFDIHSQPDWFSKCPEKRCLIVTSHSDTKTADALLFSMPDFDHRDIPSKKSRNESQYYIFYLDESPDTTREILGHYPKWDKHPGFFNLTMSYRLDSDIYSDIYLGGYEPHHFSVSDKKKADPLWFAGKRDVLWLVSHCTTTSKREEYVKKLARYINVDQIGNCDTLRDPCKNGLCDVERLMSKYKFYLAFENSLCRDYVTEKLTRALNYDVVPVVFGGVKYEQLFPSKAVINIESFPTPEALADYLKYLMRNQSAYEEYLQWKAPNKPLWHIPGIPAKQESKWCRLCKILHRPLEKRIKKNYQKILYWWFNGQCRDPVINFRKDQSTNSSRKD